MFHASRKQERTQSTETMNATALLSRMFERWYRRQIARKHLFDQVRLARERFRAAPHASESADRLEGAGRPIDSATPPRQGR